MQIFLVATDLEEYTGLVIQDFRDNLTDFALVSGPDPVEGPQQALEVRFTFTDEEDRQVWEVKALIAGNGRLGFILTASSHQALFGQYEPAVEGMFNSLSLPDSGFVPPSTEVVYSTLATDVSPVTNEPTGVGITFETTVPRIVSYLELQYLPIDSNVVWAWAQVSTTGDLETVAVVGPLPASGTGPLWSWIEPEGSLGLGFYVALVFANDALVAVSPFAIVLRHGAEFDDPQSYVDWAQFLLNFGEYETAVYAASQAIALDPAFVDAYEMRASAYSGLCGFQSASDDMTVIIELLPDEADSYSGRASMLWRALEPANALVDIDRAIQLDAQIAGFYNLRALINVALEDYGQAVIDANRGVELDPVSDANLDTRGYVYLKAGDYGNALADYEQLMSNGVDGAYALLGAGLAYFNLGDPDMAAELLELGLAIASEDTCPDPQLADLTAMAEQAIVN